MTCPPDWLEDLANVLAAEFQTLTLPAPVGCHYFYNAEDELWEVTLFTGATEIVGGRNDGARSQGKFGVDLVRLSSVFSRIDALYWQASSLGPDDELGPHISIEGAYEDQPVWVRLLARAPRRFAAGRLLKVHESRVVENW